MTLRRKRLVLLAAATVVAIGGWIAFQAAGLAGRVQPWIFDDLATVPSNEVGVLLGCSERLVGGRPNPFFVARVRAAADLLRAGKVRYLLVSGDNATLYYNEPAALRRALLEAGVPDERIVLDHAGFRTLDSVVRAREVFGQSRFTVVSQRFHVERAVYLAREHGIEAVGYTASDVGGLEGLKIQAREALARVKAVLDVQVLGTRPRFLGEPVAIPLSSA